MSCAVCGDKVNGSRYGAPACLGCIVFFRRAIFKKAKYKCLKDEECTITNESRCICRFCRLKKCFTVGMNPDAIQRRDVMGPRKKREPKPAATQPDAAGTMPTDKVPMQTTVLPPYLSIASTSQTPVLSPTSMLESLVRLQKAQRSKHYSTACMLDETLGWGEDIFDKIDVLCNSPPFRRARSRDVNFMLRTGILNAAQWANQFQPFRKIGNDAQRAILSEYGLAFLLVDQGSLTAVRAEKEQYWMLQSDAHINWILQNNTYMTPDYLKGLPDEDKTLRQVPTKVKLHPKFVLDALISVGNPMRRLEIDNHESAVLKTILLLEHKHFFGASKLDQIGKLQDQLTKELMLYCQIKCPNEAVERMGTVLLLISNIRCATRSLYEQTRVSDVFHLMTFDNLIRDVYLT